MSGEKNPLIRTKLHRPPVTEDLVPRVEMLERLGPHRARPLTLVSAPAGYGKSTLVSSWLESCDCPSTWLSLDENENDLRTFLSYFVAAVQTLFPTACQKIQTQLSTAEMPPLPVLAGTLINELDAVPEYFIFVLEDYHEIHERTVHELLGELLRHPLRSMHLVLTSAVKSATTVALLPSRASKCSGCASNAVRTRTSSTAWASMQRS